MDSRTTDPIDTDTLLIRVMRMAAEIAEPGHLDAREVKQQALDIVRLIAERFEI